MLVAHLPRDLLDVLLLFTFKRDGTKTWDGEDRRTLIAFVLHWLIFVANDDKAAYHTFKEVQDAAWCFGKQRVAALIHHFEIEGVARHAPRRPDWQCLTEEVQQRGWRLATWTERFSGKDDANRPSPGEALRILSTHSTLTRRALMWLQRRYITLTFPNYDPTSTRDDDLPFDLDHAIPFRLFGANWKTVQRRICLADPIQFKDWRHTVGDSLGNLRWLAAPDNRRRGMGPIEVERPQNGEQPSLDDYLDRPLWNKLIESETWTEKDVATFQRLIDSRTILLTKTLMNESGMADLIDIADRMNAPPASPGNV